MTPDDVSLITQIISTVGFPIFVAVWMLTKGSKDSQELKTAITELKIAIQTLVSKKGD